MGNSKSQQIQRLTEKLNTEKQLLLDKNIELEQKIESILKSFKRLEDKYENELQNNRVTKNKVLTLESEIEKLKNDRDDEKQYIDNFTEKYNSDQQIIKKQLAHSENNCHKMIVKNNIESSRRLYSQDTQIADLSKVLNRVLNLENIFLKQSKIIEKQGSKIKKLEEQIVPTLEARENSISENDSRFSGPTVLSSMQFYPDVSNTVTNVHSFENNRETASFLLQMQQKKQKHLENGTFTKNGNYEMYSPSETKENKYKQKASQVSKENHSKLDLINQTNQPKETDVFDNETNPNTDNLKPIDFPELANDQLQSLIYGPPPIPFNQTGTNNQIEIITEKFKMLSINNKQNDDLLLKLQNMCQQQETKIKELKQKCTQIEKTVEYLRNFKDDDTQKQKIISDQQQQIEIIQAVKNQLFNRILATDNRLKEVSKILENIVQKEELKYVEKKLENVEKSVGEFRFLIVPESKSDSKMIKQVAELQNMYSEQQNQIIQIGSKGSCIEKVMNDINQLKEIDVQAVKKIVEYNLLRKFNEAELAVKQLRRDFLQQQNNNKAIEDKYNGLQNNMKNFVPKESLAEVIKNQQDLEIIIKNVNSHREAIQKLLQFKNDFEKANELTHPDAALGQKLATESAEETHEDSAHAQKCLAKIEAINKDLKDIEEQISNFSGTSKDKTFLHLNELLIRNMIKLDNIESDGFEIIRQRRKAILQFAQTCQDKLKNNAILM